MNEYTLAKPLPENLKIIGDHNFDGGYDATEEFCRGRNTVLLKPEYVKDYLPEIKLKYPKDNIAIKIFISGSSDKVMEEITQIQNIYYWKGLAPRVYDLIRINDLYWAQVVEFIEGEHCLDELILENIIRNMHHSDIQHSCDIYGSNVVNGKWVDYDKFEFANYERYKRKVKDDYIKCATWGSGEGAYQDHEDLEIEGARKDTRKEMFELDNYDFKGKTVLDIGCSGGYFVNYCAKRGARAIGIDMPMVIDATRQAANISNVFNAEYYPYNLSEENFLEYIYAITGIKEFDYVFFLSMNQHIGFKEYLKDIAKTLFFETNGGEPVEKEFNTFQPKLQEMFSKVEFKGVSQEGAKRNLFICQK